MGLLAAGLELLPWEGVPGAAQVHLTHPETQELDEELLCLFFPSPVCRILGFGCFVSWANWEVSAPNAAFPGIPLDFLIVPGIFFPFREGITFGKLQQAGKEARFSECGGFGVSGAGLWLPAAFGDARGRLGAATSNPAGSPAEEPRWGRVPPPGCEPGLVCDCPSRTQRGTELLSLYLLYLLFSGQAAPALSNRDLSLR